MSYDYLSDIYEKAFNDTKSFPLAMNAYIQWLESRKTDLLSITDDSMKNYSISLLVGRTDEGDSKLITVSHYAVISALKSTNNGNMGSLFDTETNTGLTARTDDILNAYILAVESITAEIEMCKAAMDTPGSAMDVNKYVTTVRSILPSISTSVLENMRAYIEAAPTGLDCIRTWIHSQNETATAIQNNNDSVSILNADDYNGSSLLAAATQIGRTISGFFANIKFDISKLKDFFKGILDGVVNFATWLLSKVAPGISTSVEVVSDSGIGVVDYPIFQLALGAVQVDSSGAVVTPSSVSLVWNNARDVLSGKLTRVSLEDSGEYVDCPFSPLAFSNARCSVSGDVNNYDEWLEHYFTKIGDFIDIPLKSGAIRIALVSKEACGSLVPWNDASLVMQFFISVNTNSLANASSDMQAISNTKDGLRTIIRSLADVPIWYQDARYINSEDNIVDSLFNDSSEIDSDTRWIQAVRFPYLRSITYFLNAQVPLFSYIALALMNYIGLGWRTTLTDGNGLSNFLTWTTFPRYGKTGVPVSLENEYVNAGDINDGLRDGWDQTNCFFPYYHNVAVPVNVHIQTTDEQGEEVVSLFIKVLVAAAAVAVATKVFKMRRNLRLRAASENAKAIKAMQDYNAGTITSKAASTALRRANRANRLANLIGVASTSIYDPIQSGVDSLFEEYSADKSTVLERDEQLFSEITSVKNLIQ